MAPLKQGPSLVDFYLKTACLDKFWDQQELVLKGIAGPARSFRILDGDDIRKGFGNTEL